MSNSGEGDRKHELLNGEVPEILAEIEHVLRELERSKSVSLGENLSTRLETIEKKLGNLEAMLGGIDPADGSVRLNDLMEKIITSRIRADLESSMQALNMVQSYLHKDLRPARAAQPPSDDVEREARHIEVRRQEDGTERAQPPGEEALARILIHATPEDSEAVSKLSKRKREILYHLLMGKRNREISEKLGITEKTVKNNLYAIYKILRVNSRTQLIHRLLNPLIEESTV